MKRNFKLLCLLLLITAQYGCKKYLAEKPDAKLQVPQTLQDFQALIDYYPVMNYGEVTAGEISANDYYLLGTDFDALSSDNYRNMYTWQKSGLFAFGSNDWYTCYRPVFTANTIIENISSVTRDASNSSDYDNVMGEAHYIRGKAFLKITGIWTLQYDKTIAAAQLGIPLRVSSDFNQKSVRANLWDTYNQIIADLTVAAKLLPIVPLSVTRPSRPAAYALLARTFLMQGEYAMAGAYADSCLQLKSTLINFNNLNPSANYPIARFNDEVIQESLMPGIPPIANSRARIDSLLYASYDNADLRKVIFFKNSTNGSHTFKGSYEGGPAYFAGIATDELYLIRSECNARNGNTNAALSDLNTLLVNRYQQGAFVPVTESDPVRLLAIIEQERRKELLMRGLRWTDLKRYNKEGQNIQLTRTEDGNSYVLPPNDLRYALPIPDDIIQLTGMQQNPR